MKPRTQRQDAGITLLELLVAMTLFSLLSAAVLFSLRTATSTLERTRERIHDARKIEGAERALERMLSGLIRIDAEFYEPGTNQPSFYLFFQGEPRAMRFVTSYSLQQGARGAPHIVEFSVMPREDRQGVRLIVNELSYFGPASVGARMLGLQRDPAGGNPLMQFAPVVPGPQSFVLADRLPNCQFLYLDRFDPTYGDRWLSLWRDPVLPRAIRIDMGTRAVTGQVYVSPNR
jgi:prepilin-type N-terminal cleavage/methylation domain-containing protein